MAIDLDHLQPEAALSIEISRKQYRICLQFSRMPDADVVSDVMSLQQRPGIKVISRWADQKTFAISVTLGWSVDEIAEAIAQHFETNHRFVVDRHENFSLVPMFTEHFSSPVPDLADNRAAATAITIPQGFQVTTKQFDELAIANTDVRMELSAQGELIVMPPTGGTAGRKNARLTTQLTVWADREGSGISFDSSTIFILPNGARRSPDAAWVTLERWNALSAEEQDGFPPIAPDFVIELVSPSDLSNQRYEDLQQKMQEYMALRQQTDKKQR